VSNNPSHIKLIQAFEQASAILEPFGNFISVYFKSLVENGFEFGNKHLSSMKAMRSRP
jgi:hypothetical protein